MWLAVGYSGVKARELYKEDKLSSGHSCLSLATVNIRRIPATVRRFLIYSCQEWTALDYFQAAGFVLTTIEVVGKLDLDIVPIFPGLLTLMSLFLWWISGL